MAEGSNRFSNYIADRNRFNLSTPPDWWLSKLSDFDHMLVIVPSRRDRKYLLCRRRQYSAGLGDVAMVGNAHPDTNMCHGYGIVPIAPLKFRTKTPAWTQKTLDSLIAELKLRDTWAVTGGPAHLAPNPEWAEKKLVDHLEDHDKAVATKDRADLRDMFYHRARDAWKSLQARAGWRNKRASDYHGTAPKPQPLTPRPGQRIIAP